MLRRRVFGPTVNAVIGAAALVVVVATHVGARPPATCTADCQKLLSAAVALCGGRFEPGSEKLRACVEQATADRGDCRDACGGDRRLACLGDCQQERARAIQDCRADGGDGSDDLAECLADVEDDRATCAERCGVERTRRP